MNTKKSWSGGVLVILALIAGFVVLSNPPASLEMLLGALLVPLLLGFAGVQKIRNA